MLLSKKLHLVVPYGWHYNSMVEAAKAHMERGAVGQVEYILCHMGSALRELFTGQAWVHRDEALFQPELPT